MKILQKMFSEQLQDSLSFHKVGAELIAKRLKTIGIYLSERQLADIEAKLQHLERDTLTIELDDEQVSILTANPEQDVNEILRSTLAGLDSDVEDIVDRLQGKLNKMVPEVVGLMTVPVFDELKRRGHSKLRQREKQRKSFEKSLKSTWGKALGLLELLLEIALDAGADFNEEFRPIAARDNDYVFEVLTRLHARACQVCSEVITLLHTGYADGAHARWRSLHEIAVVGFFVKEFGNDVAERYLLHDAIESYKAAEQYTRYYAALGEEPLSDEEFGEMKSSYDELISRFGSSYKQEYGWASSVIEKESPRFADIERAIKLDHLRPYYRLASHNVHANPKGAFFKLGLIPEGESVLLAGPSTAGLADPGHGSAISLMQITVALLTMKPNIDRLVMCQVLMKLEDEIGDQFLACHRSLEGLQTSGSSPGNNHSGHE